MKITLKSTSFLLVGLMILSACAKEKTGKSNKHSAEKIAIDFPEVKKDKVLKDSLVEKPKVIPPAPVVPIDPGPRRTYPKPDPIPYPPIIPEPELKPTLIVPADPNQIYEVVEVDPVFPGGAEAMMKFLNENIQYPEIAKELGEQGRVYVGFVIEKDGSLSNIQVLRGVSGSLDREAKRVMGAMPNWSPGKNGGEAVRCRMRLPINFRLD